MKQISPASLKQLDGVCVIECDHKFVSLRTAKWTDDSGTYNTHFIRVDTFVCEKCLEQKEVKKDEYARDTPDWYRG